ncbi:cytochrome P450 [Nocardia puris]|uniref:Cytochrome P450 n=1 Tax=Nocardia puris TaxID=208602 RepID=A0A366D9A0_9NOCA|nr:cytochrome P450 [Nocardia puris]MBF6214117.1 cytochrome P450 [Nocardia puris]MBF6368599.1 cytochrome P450 [Nocardia puris]MBF6461501.1 cytochrome P450 [Nocardia puris]RBO86627.1 cytochrome P450 [Nocardia puris]
MTRVVNLFDPGALDDPYPLYDRLRASEPVHRVADTNFYLVGSWPLVTEAVTRPEDFSSHLTGALVHAADGSMTVFDLDGDGSAVHVLATGDDPVHRDHRKLVLPALVAKRVRALEPVIEATVRRLWDEGVDGGRVEWMSAMADRLPMTIVAGLLGLPEHDVESLAGWGYLSTELLGGVLTTERLPAVVTASAELAGYLHAAFAAARKAPGDNLIGDLARACAEDRLAPDVAVLMLVQLVGAGGESTAGLLGNAARLLALDHGLQQRIRNDLDLLPGFLEEVLRLESPFRTHHRHVVTDTVLGGTPLPAGSHLLLLWGAANRDPAVFPDPHLLRLDRPTGRTHLAFGKGIHFCVGAALARLEARLTLRTLLTRTRGFHMSPEPEAAQWIPSIFVRRHSRLTLDLE